MDSGTSVFDAGVRACIMKKMHRWQLIGYTPCGRKVDTVKTNIGYRLHEGVTCKVCLKATTLCSFLHDEWNGQSDGYPKVADN